MPLIIDAYCGAGGAAEGYARAGCDVLGVDIADQPSYRHEFYRGDAIAFIREHALEVGADAIHASPPCQAYSATRTFVTRQSPRLIEPTREAILETGLPYVIENVVGAPLIDPVTLCGSMFGLDVKRHRLFECSFPMLAPECQHHTWRNLYPTHARKDKAQLSPVVHVYGTGGGAGKDLDLWRRVMDVPWMQTKAEVAEAIPPAYTEHIATFLLAATEAQIGSPS